GVGHEVLDRLLSVRLGRTHEAHGTTLDPPGRVVARQVLAGLIDHAAALIADGAALAIEGHALDLRAPVPDCAVDSLDRVVDELTSAGDIAGAVELHALHPHARHLAVFTNIP